MTVTTHSIAPSVTELPRYRGMISVAPNGRYFQDEAGQGFIVIGHNDATSWPGLVELFNRSSVETTGQYVRMLREHGVTVSRVMLEYAQDACTYLENPIGTFRPETVRFWDDFIQLAEQHGLYLLLTPYDTFWQAQNWERYPYSAAAGGPCVTRCDWLTLPAALEAQKARWEFAIRRWGGSPNIFAWDLMNEIDLWWDCAPAEIEAYISEMAAYVRELERSIWGRTHLLTVSTSTSVPKPPLQDAIYNHPALDFATTHLYVGPGVKKPAEPITAVPEIIDGVQRSLQAIARPRPYFDSETGPVNGWITDRALDKTYHHNISWAHLATGAAGSGMRWPYTEPHCLLPEFGDNLRGLARFAARVPWAQFDSAPLAGRLSVDRDDILHTGCADHQTAIVWLLRDARLAAASSLGGLEVTIAGALDAGIYTIELWETYEGCPLTTLLGHCRDGVLRFRLPFFGGQIEDLAILIRKQD